MKLLNYLSFLFFISEFVLMILKRSKNTSAKKREDKGSLLILWLSIILTLTAGFYIAALGISGFSNVFIYYSGIVLYLSGLILRWGAIIQLNKAFTVDVAVSENQSLITGGLYKKIRHPGYAGLLLIPAGLSIALNNVISILIIIVINFAAVSYRIYIEEKLLSEEFGNLYTEYKSKTKKIIPGVY